MSIRQGKKLIASSTTNGFNLFDCKWADHILNNISWLRADTFSWQSGDVYVAAYQHLDEDLKNITEYMWTGWESGRFYSTKGMPSVGDTVSGGYYTVGEVGSDYIVLYRDGVVYERANLSAVTYTTSQTDTIGDITITYALSEDGHKICLPDQESNLVALYEATGVAWYYILDTTNRQFKLPRTKWGFTGIRSGVGGYVEAGLPNITGSFSTASDKNLGTGAFSWTDNKYSTNGGGKGGQWGINFSAKKSNPIYGNSDTVQPKATEMYLYFYVGNFEQSAIEQTAGLNAEMFNDLNAHKVIEFQAPTSANNYTWYRKYADGWVEQGGQFIATSVADGSGTAGNNIINLPIEMANNRYWYSANIQVGSNGWDYANGVILNARSTTTMTLKAVAGTGTLGLHWEVKGMAAQ